MYSLFYLAVLHMYHHLVWRIEEEEGRRKKEYIKDSNSQGVCMHKIWKLGTQKD